MSSSSRRIAILLFSLGAPEKLESVKPFLTNLFNDPAITGLPTPLRQILAFTIARKRTPEASAIYQQMGGGSPLLPNTQKQADALSKALQSVYPNDQIKCLPTMRYWHPRAMEIAQELKAWLPDVVVFLPMYPQFSTTTNRSSMLEMHQALNQQDIQAPRRLICCFPDDDGFIKASVQCILPLIKEAKSKGFDNPRLLLSAHGIPQNIIEKRGDPYLRHCQLSAQKIIDTLGDKIQDSSLCFQSRVGPLEWLRPYTEDMIRLTGEEKRALIVYPLAFVSEHSETLVELDVEYRELAEESGVLLYLRAPAVAEHPDFIAGLSQLVQKAINDEKSSHTPSFKAVCSLKNKDGSCPQDAQDCCPLDVLSNRSLEPVA